MERTSTAPEPNPHYDQAIYSWQQIINNREECISVSLACVHVVMLNQALGEERTEDDIQHEAHLLRLAHTLLTAAAWKA